jgi:ribonuclease R
MEAKCRQSSERERAAMESERAANKYKQVEYMQGFLGEEFEGVISGVASFGFWVETVENKCEGLVSLNSLLEYDDFRHVESDYALVGRRSGRRFRMGDKVTIKVISANLAKRQLDYEWVITTAEKNAVRSELDIDTGVREAASAGKPAGRRRTAHKKQGTGKGKPAARSGKKKRK